MKIDTIELVGWMPFKQPVRLDLPSGPIAIVGSHAGDARRSNRAGKSALGDAITWCLYGKHRKRLDDEIIHWQSERTEVQLTIGQMVVKRSRVRGASTKLFVQTEASSFAAAAAQVVIDIRVGLSFDEYQATACFKQGDVESIVSMRASERLELVSDWLQQSAWYEAKEIQARKTSAAEELLAGKRGASDSARAHVLTDALLTALADDLERCRVRRDEIENELRMCGKEFSENARQRERFKQYVELVALRAEADQLRKHLATRPTNTADLEAARVSERTAALAADETARALRELRSVRSSGFDGVCPIMCEACPISDQVTAVVQQSSELVATRRKAADAAAGKLAQAAVSLREATGNSLEFVNSTARYNQVVARGKELVRLLGSEVPEDAPSAEALQARHAMLRERAATVAYRIGEIESLLKSSGDAVTRHDALVKEVEAAEQAAKVSRLALRALASVPARIARQQLGALEQGANICLAGSGVSLRFSWARELADKAPVCVDCGHVYGTQRGDSCPICRVTRGKKLAQELELLCDDGSGVEEDVRFNSGGTRAIVGAAIRLSASAMLRRMRSSQAAWAIVDEPFGALDTENRESLARTFAGMLGSVGLEQALVVSHDQALLAALPHRISIDRDGSESTVRLE